MDHKEIIDKEIYNFIICCSKNPEERNLLFKTALDFSKCYREADFNKTHDVLNKYAALMVSNLKKNPIKSLIKTNVDVFSLMITVSSILDNLKNNLRILQGSKRDKKQFFFTNALRNWLGSCNDILIHSISVSTSIEPGLLGAKPTFVSASVDYSEYPYPINYKYHFIEYEIKKFWNVYDDSKFKSSFSSVYPRLEIVSYSVGRVMTGDGLSIMSGYGVNASITYYVIALEKSSKNTNNLKKVVQQEDIYSHIYQHILEKNEDIIKKEEKEKLAEEGITQFEDQLLYGRKNDVIEIVSNANDHIVCPNCGTKQKANRGSCYNCGQKFHVTESQQ